MKHRSDKWILCGCILLLILAGAWVSYVPSSPSVMSNCVIHNGHSYIVLKCGYQTQTIIHDPDCSKCAARK